eukprot:39379_1
MAKSPAFGGHTGIGVPRQKMAVGNWLKNQFFNDETSRSLSSVLVETVGQVSAWKDTKRQRFRLDIHPTQFAIDLRKPPALQKESQSELDKENFVPTLNLGKIKKHSMTVKYRRGSLKSTELIRNTGEIINSCKPRQIPYVILCDQHQPENSGQCAADLQSF